MIAENHGYQLLTARVHDDDHVHVFVSAEPKVCILDIVCVLKSNSARLLFLEFLQIKKYLWVVICGLRVMLLELLVMLLVLRSNTT